MASSAEAIESIQSFVRQNGTKMTLGQIIDKGGPDVAGWGVDRDTDITFKGLDLKAFQGGRLTGRLACRAVLVEPGVSRRFVPAPDGEDVRGLLHLRTRFTYEMPNRSAVPTAPTMGGTVMHLAIHNLLLASEERPGDGARLDDYYERMAAREAAIRNGQIDPEDPGAPVSPQMPDLHVRYAQELPVVPVGRGQEKVRSDTLLRHDALNTAFNRLQQEQLGARVLALGTQGYVSETELPDWAVAFTGQAA